MKKWISLLLAICLLFALSACGAKQPEASIVVSINTEGLGYINHA